MNLYSAIASAEFVRQKHQEKKHIDLTMVAASYILYHYVCVHVLLTKENQRLFSVAARCQVKKFFFI